MIESQDLEAHLREALERGHYLVFMSYVHKDDEAERGRIRRWFAKELEEKIQFRGADVDIFLDHDDIRWGQDWRDQIEQALDRVLFFMPIITPRYFKSEWCGREVEWFMERERTLGRHDLVLPIYYQETPQLKEAGNPLAAAMERRQYVDWTKTRVQYDSGKIRRELEALADRLHEAIQRVVAVKAGTAAGPGAMPPPPGAEAAAAVPETVSMAAPEPRGPAPTVTVEKPVLERTDGQERAEPEPTQLTVGEGGDFASVVEAVQQAPPGSEIIVKPGVYVGAIVIEKPLHLRGEGDHEAVIESKGDPALSFGASMGVVTNLVLRQVAEGAAPTVEVRGRRFELEDCIIESSGGSGVKVVGAADPSVRRNVIRGGGENGIEVLDHAQGRYEENDVSDTAMPGIGIATTGTTTVRGNRVHQCRDAGVLLLAGGQALLEGNEIFDNAGPGIVAAEGANPIVRDNDVHGGQDAGIVVTDDSGGVFEHNDVFENTGAGISVTSGSAPTVRGNRIHEQSDSGLVFMDAEGIVEDNEVWANQGPGVSIQSGGAPSIRRNTIRDGKHAGVYVEEGQGVLENNAIHGNEGGGVVIAGGADPLLRENQIYEGQTVGVYVNGGAGTLEGNEVFGNAGAGVWIEAGGTPTLTRNDIRDNGDGGVLVRDGSEATIEGNSIHGNTGVAVAITERANPVVAGNQIYEGNGPGILVAEQSLGTIQENSVYSNASDGIVVLSGSTPTIRGNTIREGADTGIFVNQGGAGSIEQNDIYGNARAGIWVQAEGSNPTITGNRIHDHRESGIVVVQGGSGTIEGNQVFRNGQAGLLVAGDSDVIVRNNLITLNGGVGVEVLDGQRATIEQNDLSGNTSGPVQVGDPALWQYYLGVNQS